MTESEAQELQQRPRRGIWIDDEDGRHRPTFGPERGNSGCPWYEKGMSDPRVLVIDDDDDIRGLVRTLLERSGATVRDAPNGKEGLREFHSWRPDLVILDVSMPELDGWNVLERIRDMSDVPVMMLTARGDELERVRGLQAGADDYVVKPFGTEELVARIRAVLRRQADVTSGEPVIRSGDLEIDLARRHVSVNGRAVHLTPTEYELLRYLALHAGKPVSHTTLLRQVWGEYAVGDKYNTRYVVAQIRKKLGDDPANPRYIVNEPGVGYRLEG